MSQRRRTIAIDFDGVLHAYRLGWHDGTIYDVPNPGARESLFRLSQTHNLVVYTAREDIQSVEKWCKVHFPKVGKVGMEVTNKKPRAVVYIDDRAIRHISWDNTIKQLTDLGIIDGGGTNDR